MNLPSRRCRNGADVLHRRAEFDQRDNHAALRLSRCLIRNDAVDSSRRGPCQREGSSPKHSHADCTTIALPHSPQNFRAFSNFAPQ